MRAGYKADRNAGPGKNLFGKRQAQTSAFLAIGHPLFEVLPGDFLGLAVFVFAPVNAVDRVDQTVQRFGGLGPTIRLVETADTVFWTLHVE